MNKSKLILLIKSLSTKDLRGLKDFIASPYFNKNDDIIRFYNYLLKQAPHFKAKAINRNYVYEVVFYTKKFDEKQFYYLKSNLVKLIEKYLLIKEFEHDKLMPEYYLLRSAIKRGLEKSYAENLRKAKAGLEKHNQSEIGFYFKKYLFDDLENQKFLTSNVRKADNALQRAADNFDHFYLAQKLKYACEILSRNKILKSNYTIMLFDELKSHIENTDYRDIPVIHAYSLIFFILIKRGEEECFSELKKLLKESSWVFKKENLYDLIIYAINYCFAQMRIGNTDYHAEALDLYIVGLDSEVLLNDGVFSPWDFKNIVRLGINLQRYTWTSNFIYNNSNNLPRNSRDNALNYNLAELYYAQKEWDKVIEHLSLVKFTDVSYSLGTKLLLCKVYYQTNETEVLFSLINSFKIYLKRQKGIIDDVRTSYLNFLYFLSQIMKNETDITTLKERIQTTSILMLRNWLLNVIETKEQRS